MEVVRLIGELVLHLGAGIGIIILSVMYLMGVLFLMMVLTILILKLIHPGLLDRFDNYLKRKEDEASERTRGD